MRMQFGAVDSFAVSAACNNWLSKGGTVGLYDWTVIINIGNAARRTNN